MSMGYDNLKGTPNKLPTQHADTKSKVLGLTCEGSYYGRDTRSGTSSI
jgi:hypothetical protein